MKRGKGVIYCLAFLFIFSISYASAVDVSSCGTLNSANTVYDLIQNISSNGSTCISIAANNITFDGHGYTITDNVSVYGNIGIYFSSGNGSTAKNTRIFNYSYGIYLPAGTNHTVLNNTVLASTYVGLYIPSISNVTVINNTINGSNLSGVWLVSTGNNTFSGNQILSSGEQGLYLSNAHNNTFINNTVRSNYINGIYLATSSNNSFTYNVISNTTTLSGLVINQTSRNNLIYRNNFSHNNYNGVYLIDSVNYTNVTENIILNSSGYGLSFVATSLSTPGFYQTVHNNTIINSSYDGLACSLHSNSSFTSNNITGTVSNAINLLGNCRYNLFANNTLSNSGFNNIVIYASDLNNFTNNTLYNSTESSVDLLVSHDNFFSYNSINLSGKNAINLTRSNRNNFTNINIYLTNSSYFDFALNNSNSTLLSNISSVANFSIVSSIGFSFENTQYGFVKFLDIITGESRNLSSDLVVANNSIYINESNSAFNSSANVSIYGNASFNMTTPAVLRNGASCTSCFLFSAITDSTIIFNVSSGGTYSIVETAVASTPSSSSSSSGGDNLGRFAKESLENGVNRTLAKGNYFTFVFENKSYKVNLTYLDSQKIVFKINSSNQEFTINIRESDKVDLNEDDYFDLKVSYFSYSANRSRVGFVFDSVKKPSLWENTPADSAQTSTTDSTSTENIEENSSFVLYAVLIVLVIGVGVFVFLRYRSKI